LLVEGATQAPAKYESLERNERVCGECPTPLPILIFMENMGLMVHEGTFLTFLDICLDNQSYYGTILRSEVLK